MPGCRRTRGNDNPQAAGDEWLCGRHWPLVPVELRKLLRRRWKMGRELAAHGTRIFDEDGRAWTQFAERAAWLAHRRNWQAEKRLWQRARTRAIDAALGIG